MDGLFIWDKTGSQKRKYKDTKKRHPETAKLNKSHWLEMIQNLLKTLRFSSEDLENFLISISYVQPTFCASEYPTILNASINLSPGLKEWSNHFLTALTRSSSCRKAVRRLCSTGLTVRCKWPSPFLLNLSCRDRESTCLLLTVKVWPLSSLSWRSEITISVFCLVNNV